MNSVRMIKNMLFNLLERRKIKAKQSNGIS